MKRILKSLIAVMMTAILLLSVSSCGKKEKETFDSKKSESAQKNEQDTEKEGDEVISDDSENNNSSPDSETEISDEKKAEQTIFAYVSAAKKLDFAEMDKYISDSNSLPILDAYRESYSKYSISDKRIKELCRARLGTYHFTPVAYKKSGNKVVVTVKLSRVNMESLANKWMETLGNNYPEYTSLTEEQMTPEVVDVLIQTMIDVLNTSEATVEEQKDFVVENKNGNWIINAKNEDFFPSN